MQTKNKQKEEEISKSIYMILFIHVYDDASQLKVTITTIIFIFPKTKTCLRLNWLKENVYELLILWGINLNNKSVHF